MTHFTRTPIKGRCGRTLVLEGDTAGCILHVKQVQRDHHSSSLPLQEVFGHHCLPLQYIFPPSCEHVYSHHALLLLAQQCSQTSPIPIKVGLLSTTPSPKNTDQLLRQGPWAMPTPLHTGASCRTTKRFWGMAHGSSTHNST